MGNNIQDGDKAVGIMGMVFLFAMMIIGYLNMDTIPSELRDVNAVTGGYNQTRFYVQSIRTEPNFITLGTQDIVNIEKENDVKSIPTRLSYDKLYIVEGKSRYGVKDVILMDSSNWNRLKILSPEYYIYSNGLDSIRFFKSNSDSADLTIPQVY